MRQGLLTLGYGDLRGAGRVVPGRNRVSTGIAREQCGFAVRAFTFVQRRSSIELSACTKYGNCVGHSVRAEYSDCAEYSARAEYGGSRWFSR